MATPIFTKITPTQNNYSGTISQILTTGAITPTVTPTPDGSTGYITIYDPDDSTKTEICKYTANASGVLTIPLNGRGLSGTIAQAHPSGKTVIFSVTAELISEIDVLLENTVYKTGDQTIAGIKTFSTGIKGSTGGTITEFVTTPTNSDTVSITAGALFDMKLDDFATPDDNTDLNASVARHGLLPKLSGDVATFLNGNGLWTVPATSGGGGGDLLAVNNLADVANVATALSNLGGITNAQAKTIKLDDFATPDDNTDLNATTLRHGLLPKLGGGTTNFLRADGAWNDPFPFGKTITGTTGTGLIISGTGEAKGFNVQTQHTTGNSLYMLCTSLTTGSIANFTSNSNNTSSRNLVAIYNTSNLATGTIPLYISQNTDYTSTFKRYISLDGLVIWKSNGTVSPNSNLPATAGDICLNGTSNKMYRCTGTTNWSLINDLPVVTSIGTPGVDTNIPTEKAVRDAINETIGSYHGVFEDVFVTNVLGQHVINFNNPRLHSVFASGLYITPQKLDVLDSDYGGFTISESGYYKITITIICDVVGNGSFPLLFKYIGEASGYRAVDETINHTLGANSFIQTYSFSFTRTILDTEIYGLYFDTVGSSSLISLYLSIDKI